MRLLFFGSGAFGIPTLASLVERHEVVAVVSQPDKPAGRKRVLTPTPVAQWASRRGLTVHREGDVNSPAFVRRVADDQAEASVVIAFGQKLGEPLIDAMGSLAVNLHASLLPSYRGAAPINWAMIDGLQTTGVSVIALAQRMDAGEVYGSASLSIDPRETAGELHDRLAQLGPAAIGGVLDDLEAGTLNPVIQDESKATKARKFTKADGTVDFNQPAAAVRARVHGLTPWPGCRVLWHRAQAEPTPVTLVRVEGLDTQTSSAQPGSVIQSQQIACANGAIRPLELQIPGKRVMPLAAFTAANPMIPGQHFTQFHIS
ncbi:MAG: methionyl-tRNA formyltransferase [Planctomycetota bacterium]